MFGYLKKRYDASVSYRVSRATHELEERLNYAGSAISGTWSGVGDPFEFHRRAVVGALSEGVAAVYGYDVAGDIAEFGTMSGRTATGLAQAISSCDEHLGYAARAYGHAQRELFLFDSFEGLPDIDSDTVDGKSPHVVDGVWSKGSLKGISPETLRAMINAHLSSDRFHILEGWFSDTVPMLSSERRFALLHIDSDLYSSARDVLDGLFSRGLVSRGAYIFFDDWNCNRADPDSGERLAWRECVETYGIKYSEAGMYGIFAQRIVIHDYEGSPVDIAGQRISAAQALASAVAETPVAVTGTSSDVYDHQEASKHYHQSSGMSDMDADFLPIYERCRQYSMTSPDRMYSLYKAIQYIQHAHIQGDIVECGVWRGGSMMVVAECLKLFGGQTRQLHLFDTYEGLPEPTQEDVDVWGNDAEAWWKQKRTSATSSDWARAHLDEVRANMALTGYPEKRITYVKGMVEDTIPAQAPAKISLLRLDTDWYASTKHEMEHLFPRLAKNGVLIIDDYGHFKGAKQAIDEYLATAKIPLLLMRIDYTGRIAVKTHG